MITYPVGFFAPRGSSGVRYNFRGSIPSGAIVNTSGDPIYRMVSPSVYSALVPGEGVGVFEDRGAGPAMLVGAGTIDRPWKNWIPVDYGPPDYAPVNLVVRMRWDHSAEGSYANVPDQAQGPTGDETILLPRTRKDDAALVSGISALVQGYIYLSCPSCPSGGEDSFFTIMVKDGPSPPTILGDWHGTADGAREDMRDTGGSSWRQLRVQGRNGGFAQLFPAGNFGQAGGVGQLYVTMAMCGSGAAYLPLVLGVDTSEAHAWDTRIAVPSNFMSGGGLYAKGQFSQIVDDPRFMVQTSTNPRRTLIDIPTTSDGRFGLYGQYSPYGSSHIDWVLRAYDEDFIVAQYASNGAGQPGSTTPGVGGNYLRQGRYAIGVNPNQGIAYLRIAFAGSYYTALRTEGVDQPISTPTSAHLHVNADGEEPFPAHLLEVTAGSDTFDAAQVFLLGDSQEDVTGSVDSRDTRPSNFVLTEDEVVAGLAIENIAVHGDTIQYQLARLNDFAAAFPDAIAAVQLWIVDIGWNNYPDTNNAAMRVLRHQLLDRIQDLSDAPIALVVPSPAKGAVSTSPTMQARYEADRTDILGSQYPQATYKIDYLTRLTQPSMNAGAYGGTVDDLYAPYSDDGLHYTLAGKQAKGALIRMILALAGIVS